MKIMLIMLALAFTVSLSACEMLGISVEKVCTGPDKEGYLTCATTYTDHPACIGECKKL